MLHGSFLHCTGNSCADVSLLVIVKLGKAKIRYFGI